MHCIYEMCQELGYLAPAKHHTWLQLRLKQPKAKGRLSWKNLARSTPLILCTLVRRPSFFLSLAGSRFISRSLGSSVGEDGGGREHPSLLAARDFRLSLLGKSGDCWCPASWEPPTNLIPPRLWRGRAYPAVQDSGLPHSQDEGSGGN